MALKGETPSYEGLWHVCRDILTAVGNISLDQNAIQTGIEAATNLDGIEGSLSNIESQLTTIEGLMADLQWSEFNGTPANLTAPGSSTAVDCSACTGNIIAFIGFEVTNIDTNIVVQARGTIGAQTVILGPTQTITENGLASIVTVPIPFDTIFLEFVSETGGTAAVIQDILITARGQGI